MATQSVPSFHTLSSAAAVPALRRGLMSRRLPTHRIVGPSRRREEKQVQDRQKLLVDMLPLVKRVAFKIRQHLPPHVEMDELIANGVLGLIDAIAKFDARKRVKLESYARHRIRGGILDGLRNADPASRDLRRKIRKIQKLYRELEVKLGRIVKDEEIAKALGTNLAQWHRTLNEIQPVGSDGGVRTISAGPTDMPVSRRIEPAVLEDNGPDPFDLCYRREQRTILTRALSRLRRREQQIITLYYERDLTMQQIAERMGVDASRVSQIHSAALVRLKANVDFLLHPSQAETSVTGTLSMVAGAGA